MGMGVWEWGGGNRRNGGMGMKVWRTRLWE